MISKFQFCDFHTAECDSSWTDGDVEYIDTKASGFDDEQRDVANAN